MWSANLNFIKWLVDASHAIDASAEVSQHEETIRNSTGALGESSKLGWSWRYHPRRRLMKAVVHEWPPVPGALILHYGLVFCSWVFQDTRDIRQAHFHLLLSWVCTIEFNRVPRSSMKSEVTRCPASTRLLLILVSGRCIVGREAVSHLEFPVWVLGRLLGIPILIRNLLFQLRSLPDKREPHTRCAINSSVQFCFIEAPSSNRLLTCSAETTVGFLVRKPICPRLFVFAVVTLSNILCTRKQMINGVVGGGGLFLVFLFLGN